MIHVSQRSPSSLLIIIVLIFGWLLMGCGYHFRADGKPIGIDIASLAIPLVTSTSSSLGFEAEFTTIIREEFINNATIPLVSVDKAQAVLTGNVFDIITEPLSFDQTEVSVAGNTSTFSVTRSRRLIIKLDAKLTEQASGKLIWHDPAMVEKAAFDVGTDPLVNRYNEQRAVEQIARLLAKRIFLKTAERF